MIDPNDLIEKYGADALRYYFLAKFSPFMDGDFSEEKLKNVYNGDLANGLGNLVSRTLTLVEKAGGSVPEIGNKVADDHPLRVNNKIHNWKKTWKDIDTYIPLFEFDKAIGSIWKHISEVNKYINDSEPWNLIDKDRDKFNWVMYGVLDSLHQIAWQIYQFMPETSIKITKALQIEGLLKKEPNSKDSWTNLKPGTKIVKIPALFPKI